MSFNTVLIYLCGDQIASIVDEASGNARRGSKQWICHYMPSMKDVRKNLSEEEIAAIFEVKEEWENAGVPEELQAK